MISKGPWHLHHKAFAVLDADDDCVCDLTGCDGDHAANARLIAAGPEMLEALKNIGFNCDVSGYVTALCVSIIQKAEGKIE